MKTSTELAAELAELEAELEAVKADYSRAIQDAKDAEQRQFRARARLEKLCGYSWDTGSIKRKENELAAAQLREADKKLPKVVFANPRDDEYVVSRVTPKRIYVRRVGHSIESQFGRDGKPIGGCGYATSINIPATFPEGVK